MTLIWGLIATIWMPYVNARRTYEAVAQGIAHALPDGVCVERRDVGMRSVQRSIISRASSPFRRLARPRHARRCSCSTAAWRTAHRRCPATRSAAGGRRGDDNERFVL